MNYTREPERWSALDWWKSELVHEMWNYDLLYEAALIKMGIDWL